MRTTHKQHEVVDSNVSVITIEENVMVEERQMDSHETNKGEDKVERPKARLANYVVSQQLSPQ